MPSKELSAYYETIYTKAQKLAHEAVEWEVTNRGTRHPFRKNDDSAPLDHIPGDCCGYATIRVNGNSSFGRWAKKHHGWRTFDPPGLCADDFDFGQSYLRDLIYAKVFVAVLREAGIDVWYTHRLD